MSTLAATQAALARHIRNPQRHAAPADIEPRRLAIYNELIYNTVEGFVAGGFPVLRTLLDDADWHALVRRFLDGHGCQTPYFLRIAGEFLDFLEAGGEALALPAFARELAHYEWVELALDVSDAEVPEFDPAADLLEGVLRLSPLAWPLAYRWPVHRIARDCRPTAPPALPTCLLVYRGGDDRVHFIECNPATLRLLELLEPGRLRGREALAALADELGPAGATVTGEAGANLLGALAARGVLGVPGL